MLTPRCLLASLSLTAHTAAVVEKVEVWDAFWKLGMRNTGGTCDALSDWNMRMSAGRTAVEVGMLRFLMMVILCSSVVSLMLSNFRRGKETQYAMILTPSIGNYIDIYINRFVVQIIMSY